MNKTGLPAAVYLLADACTHAQNGSVQVASSSLQNGKPMVLQVAAPFLKFNNIHILLVCIPHNGDRDLPYRPDAGRQDQRVDIVFIKES